MTSPGGDRLTGNGRVELAPVYDVFSTLLYPDADTTPAMFVNGVTDLAAITLDDVAAGAVGWGLDRDRVEERIAGTLASAGPRPRLATGVAQWRRRHERDLLATLEEGEPRGLRETAAEAGSLLWWAVAAHVQGGRRAVAAGGAMLVAAMLLGLGLEGCTEPRSTDWRGRCIPSGPPGRFPPRRSRRHTSARGCTGSVRSACGPARTGTQPARGRPARVLTTPTGAPRSRQSVDPG